MAERKNVVYVAAACFLSIAICLCIAASEVSFLAEWHDKTLNCDLNCDGKMEQIELSEKSLTVFSEKTALWETSADWKTEDFLVTDIDSDGRSELLLLVWKRGSYGESRPFWVERDDTSYSQHIFIYRLDGDRIDAVWMSSALRPEVDSWNNLENGVLEITTPKGEITEWTWRTWGLERIDNERLRI